MSSSLEMHSSGRPKGSTRQAVQKRRLEYYRLWLQGWSMTEIAEGFGVNQSSVSRHIDTVRQARSWADKDARDRYRDLLQLTYDQALVSQREAWRGFYGNKDKPEVQIGFLGRVQTGISVLTRLLPDEREMAFWDLAAKSQRMHEEVRKEMEKLVAKGLITPLPGLKRPDWIEKMEKASSQG